MNGEAGKAARQACGKALRARRQAMEMTQEVFAALVGVTQPSLHLWETGEHQPTYENRIRLAAVLGEDLYAIKVTPAEDVA